MSLMSRPLAQRIPSHFLFLCHYFSGSMIDIRRLKGFASERLNTRSRVRNVLLSEREQLTVNDFLTKMDIWITLFNQETANS